MDPAWILATFNLGLRGTKEGFEGIVCGQRVTIKRIWGGMIQIRVDPGKSIPRSLSVRTGRGPSPDIRVGDPDFDRAVHISGDEVEALAVLDRDCRTRILELMKEREAVVEGGQITASVSRYVSDPNAIESTVHQMIRAAGSLALEGSVAERLAANACSQDLAGVRLRNLAILQERFPATSPPW
jgi:hypothetical protein